MPMMPPEQILMPAFFEVADGLEAVFVAVGCAVVGKEVAGAF